MPARACLICGLPSIAGMSRCSKHRRGKPKTGPNPYDHAYQEIRAKVLKGDLICHLCGEGENPAKGPFQTDHVIPHSLGGASTRENLKPAHRTCNIRKGGANRVHGG